jgi:hypothetical protein
LVVQRGTLGEAVLQSRCQHRDARYITFGLGHLCGQGGGFLAPERLQGQCMAFDLAGRQAQHRGGRARVQGDGKALHTPTEPQHRGRCGGAGNAHRGPGRPPGRWRIGKVEHQAHGAIGQYPLGHGFACRQRFAVGKDLRDMALQRGTHGQHPQRGGRHRAFRAAGRVAGQAQEQAFFHGATILTPGTIPGTPALKADAKYAAARWATDLAATFQEHFYGRRVLRQLPLSGPLQPLDQ